MDRKSTLIYRVFYFILHSVATIYETIEVFYTKLVDLCHEFAPVNTKSTPKKIPTHLTVLLGTEEPSLTDLSNLIFWCLSTHITFISFYDHKGTLKHREDELRQLIHKRRSPGDHVIWHSGPHDAPKNGFVGRKIHVKVLSEDDGRWAVAAAARRVAEGCSDSFEAELRKSYEFPDPELAMCCGKTFSLFGYPPWQIRVTEFLNVGSHHNFSYNKFIGLLCRYSRCEQRFGK